MFAEETKLLSTSVNILLLPQSKRVTVQSRWPQLRERDSKMGEQNEWEKKPEQNTNHKNPDDKWKGAIVNNKKTLWTSRRKKLKDTRRKNGDGKKIGSQDH